VSAARIPIGGGTPGLEAGARDRRLVKFQPPRVHVNELIRASGPTVLARARFLVRNNPYVANACEYFAAQIVGTGIVPSWKQLRSATMKKDLAQAFLRWTDEADAEGLTDFYGLQRRAARELFIAGEVFFRLRPRRPEDGLSVPLQLQMLAAEMLPVDDNRVLPNGNEVRQGIEFDAIGRRVAYHFWRAHPDDGTARLRVVDGTRQTRVPAEQVLHLMDPVEAGQLRGLSRLAPGIVPAWMLDLYDDAELERKRVAAYFTVFRKVPAELDAGAHEVQDQGDGTAIQEMAPGAQIVLPPGEDITIAAPADVGGSYEAFQYRNLLRLAAGIGVPYTALTGDMVRSNYSNERAAELKFRRRAEAFQHSVMVFLFCRPVALAWLRAAGMAGAVKGLSPQRLVNDWPRLSAIAWTPPSWPWVDPTKDVKAAREEVEAGFRSRASVIVARGEDPDQVDDEIAEDRAREARLRLHETPSAFAAKPAASARAEPADAPEPADPAPGAAPDQPEGPPDE
jgi:lambda family phage portal protein